MIIIDLVKKTVQQNPNLDLDVVVMKGATPEFVNSLAQLIEPPVKPAVQPWGVCRAMPATPSMKVGLGANSSATDGCGAVDPTNGCNQQQPVSACGQSASTKSVIAGNPKNMTFDEIYNQLGAILEKLSEGGQLDLSSPEAPEPQAEPQAEPQDEPAAATNPEVEVAPTCDAHIKELQGKWAETAITYPDFIETLRKAAQDSAVLSPGRNLITTRNIKAAVALSAYYGIDGAGDDFHAADGVAQISEGNLSVARHALISTDTLVHMATDIKLLRRFRNRDGIWVYRVSSEFGILLTRTIRTHKFVNLRAQLGLILNEIEDYADKNWPNLTSAAHWRA